MASDDVVIRIGGQIDGLSSALSSAKSSVSSFASEARSTLGGLSSSFSGVQGAIQGISTALGAGVLGGALAGVAAAFDKFATRATEISTMSAAVGVSTSQFQAMGVVADETGVSIEVFSRAAERLSNLLNEARDGSGAAIAKLHDLGITNEQIAAPTFTVNELLGVLHDRLNDAATATATHNALLKELGTRGIAAAEAIKNYDGSLAGVAATMSKVNGLTDEEISKLKAAKGAWSEFGTNIENVFSRALTKVTEFFGYMNKNLDASASPIANLFNVLNGAGAGAQSDRSGVIQRQADAQTTAAIEVAASHTTTEATLKDLKDQIAATAQGSAAKLALVKQYYEESLQYYGNKNVDTVRAAHAELLAEERAYQAKRLEMEKEATAAINASSRATAEVVKKGLEESKATLTLMTEDAKGQYKALEEVQLGSIDRGIEAVHAEFAAHTITNSEELAATKALLAAEWSAEQEYYAKLRALAVAAGTSTGSSDDALEAAHQKNLKALQTADETYNKQALAEWKQMGQQMQTSFASNLTAMIEGQKTFSQGMKSLISSLLDSWIQMLVKLGIQWVTTQLANKAASKTTATSQISDSAGVAGAAGTASFAGAPWPVDIGAPAFGAEMAAAAGSFGSLSAYGGFDVPEHVNPRVQLHQREMVLPAQYADVIRGMSGRGSGGGDVHHHHHYGPSLDAKSFHQYVHTPAAQDSIASALQTTYNRGRRPK